jgi:hypothetical protein
MTARPGKPCRARWNAWRAASGGWPTGRGGFPARTRCRPSRDGHNSRKAPRCMRSRGLTRSRSTGADCSAPHAVRPITGRRFPGRRTRFPGSSASGVSPGWAIVFGGESIFTAQARCSATGFGRHFQDFLVIHKSSTKHRPLSPAQRTCPPVHPQPGPQRVDAGRRPGRRVASTGGLWNRACQPPNP